MASCLCPSQSKETQNQHPKVPCKPASPGGSPLSIPCHCFWGSGDRNITRESNQSNQNCASVHISALQRPSQVLGVILHSLLGEGRKGCCQRIYSRLKNSSFSDKTVKPPFLFLLKSRSKEIFSFFSLGLTALIALMSKIKPPPLSKCQSALAL